MATINISLPERLKNEAQDLVNRGFYVSFSDLVRDSLRQVISKNQYDLWAEETEEEIKKGKAKILKSKEEIKDYFKSL